MQRPPKSVPTATSLAKNSAAAQKNDGTDNAELRESPTESKLASDAKTELDLLTNRRKPLTQDSSLAEVATEDVINPQKPENIVIAKSVSQNGSNKNCELDETCTGQEIGISYKDSTPCWPEVAQPPKGAPNVVFIVLDDVGFGQLGCFGGPIKTPNIDRLARDGLRYNDFHTTAICSPTRACLLTGRNHHSVGIGMIVDAPTGYPGYYMNLSKNAATLPEMLRANGFNTYGVGKWHLGPANARNAIGPFDNWPTGRGFEKFYGFLGAETNQWYPDLISGTTRVDPPETPEEGYHFSEDIVDHAIKYISDGLAVEPTKPYFLYLAFGACHAPHQVPQKYIDMYKGKFDKGWDVVRENTLARQKKMGIVPPNTELPPRNPGISAWNDLSVDQKKAYAAEQEVYAGFLTHTDTQIGKFLKYLERTRQLNNTMIVLISDNGASAEGGLDGTSDVYYSGNGIKEPLSSILANINELGGTKAYNHYAMGWAMAGDTPFKWYKQQTYEGGIHDPMIIYYPKLIKDEGEIRQQYTHAIDIVPTVLEVLDLQAPKYFNGYPQKPIEGVSFASTFTDRDAETGKYIQYYEMLGNRALWYNGWKATAYHKSDSGGDFDNDTWELFNISEDFSEVHDLASANPQKLQDMIDLWFDQAGKYNVLPLDDRQLLRLISSIPYITGVFTYFSGVEKSLDPYLPDTRERSYNLKAYVDIPKRGAEGVLFSIGGRFGGLSFFIKDGHLVYDYNYAGTTHYKVESNIKVPPGRSVLEVAFDLKDCYKGTASLYINGKAAGSTPVVTQPGLYSFEEGLEVGKDPQTPVAPDDYESPFEFNGKLEKVVLEVKASPVYSCEAESNSNNLTYAD